MATIDNFNHLYHTYNKTSSIHFPCPNSFILCKNEKHLKTLFKNNPKKVCAVISHKMEMVNNDNIYYLTSTDPLLTFTKIHNTLNKERKPRTLRIHKTAEIDKTAIIGCEGQRWIEDGDRIIKMKHMGNVIISHDVSVGPYSTIIRAILDWTYISSNVKIGSHCNIGHNCFIGTHTMLTSGVIIAGSVSIGSYCWFGVNSTVIDHVDICNYVKIGAGAVVTKNITEPGTYAGIPAKRIGDFKYEL